MGNGIPGCDYPYGGKEITAPSYEVLANTTAFDISASWIAQGSVLPYNALRAGSDSNGAAIYPCIAPYNGDLHPGKTEPGWGTCDISYGGAEIWVPASYQILTPSFTSPPLALAVQPYTAGTDTNGSILGICSTSYSGVLEVGKYLSSGVCDFGYGGKEVPLTSNFQILALHEDTTTIVENFNITFPSGVALGGTASVTIKDDGSYVFTGTLHDSGAFGYSDSTLVVLRSSSGVAFTFARSGSAAGTDSCFGGSEGCRDDSWTITGTNPAIAAHWEDLKKGVIAEQNSDASINFADLWSQAKAALGDVQQIVAVVGPIVAALLDVRSVTRPSP